MGEARPTIVVVDDAAEVRALVRTRLRISGLLEVVGEADDGAGAVARAAELRPDLLLLDVSMPGMDGLEALPAILGASPGTRVVMYSGFSEEGLADRALALGATAFLEKSADLDALAADLVGFLGVERPDRPSPGPETGVDPAAEQRVLTEHLERFREVFEDAAIGMATVTLAGQVVRANRALATLLERTPDDLVGVRYAALAGSAAPALEQLLADLLGGTLDAGRVEHDVRRADGPRRVVATFSPVLDSGRRPLYLFVQVQDVSQQRGAEERLRASEERFRLLVETVQDYAIFMLGPDGTIESWNAGAERAKGYAAEEIIGQHFRVFYPADLQEARHPEHELELALRDGRYEEEGWRIRKDGSRFWANVVITAVHDTDGRHVGFAKVTRDITERRQMLEDQAHFLAVTAHELRTPIGVLGGTADVLAQHWAELADDERDELLTGMTASAARLRRLLDDLLTASRLQGRRLELDVADLDVGDVVEESVATARRGSPGATIELQREPDLRVRGDAVRLGQLVDNLVGNALLHGASPVSVGARRSGDRIRITVRDAGPGVPDAVRPRLFEQFSTGRSAGGTGLGLYLVRQLARAHGGEASYEDGVFVVDLPAES